MEVAIAQEVTILSGVLPPNLWKSVTACDSLKQPATACGSLQLGALTVGGPISPYPWPNRPDVAPSRGAAFSGLGLNTGTRRRDGSGGAV